MKLHAFQERPVEYIETIQVKDGVECDTYSFIDDKTQDLAIVRVTRGYTTPLQKVLKGNKTIEGFLKGKGKFTVQLENGTINTYDFDTTSINKEVEIRIGQIVQWAASSDTDLIFYEICDPPYQDGRFENLPE